MFFGPGFFGQSGFLPLNLASPSEVVSDPEFVGLTEISDRRVPEIAGPESAVQASDRWVRQIPCSVESASNPCELVIALAPDRWVPEIAGSVVATTATSNRLVSKVTGSAAAAGTENYRLKFVA